MLQQLYSPIGDWIRGIPFPLKIGTIEPILILDQDIIKYVCQKFQNVSPPALNIFIATSEGLLALGFSLDSLHTAPLQTQFFSLNPLSYYILLTSMLSHHSFSTFINFSICSFLPDFLSIIDTYSHCPIFIFKETNLNNIFLFPSPLFDISPPPLKLSDP